MGTGRLILSPPAAGDWNMSVDEALMVSAAESKMVTLRLYRWGTATVSLGYFQNVSDREQHAASIGCPIVRRHSGGGAIIHDRELTYGLVFPLLNQKRGENAEVYRAVHDAVIEWLKGFGILSQRYADTLDEADDSEAAGSRSFLCFQRRSDDDLVIREAKILGSAQRRGNGGLLQHGSLLLRASPAAPELPGICDLADRDLSLDYLDDELALSLADAIGRSLDIHWSGGELSDQEIEHAKAVQATKFGKTTWTCKR